MSDDKDLADKDDEFFLSAMRHQIEDTNLGEVALADAAMARVIEFEKKREIRRKYFESKARALATLARLKNFKEECARSDLPVAHTLHPN